MAQNISQEQWQLIVNGVPKPWPVTDYLSHEITVDLNWGIDTSIYESRPLTFNVSDVLEGVHINGVSVNEEKHQIICEIPIFERTKNLKVIVDWSSLKAEIKTALKANVDGEEINIEDGMLQLKGKNITASLTFYFNGYRCESAIETDMDMVHVVLPYKHMVDSKKTWWRNSRILVLFIAGTLIGLLIGYTLKRPVVKEVEVVKVECRTDTVYVRKTLYTAQEFLAKDRWVYSEMERIPELQGLFNDLKQFRFKAIQKRLDRPVYRYIPQVIELLHTIEKIDDDHFPRKTYSCDDTITIRRYIRELSFYQRMGSKSSLDSKIKGF